MVDDFSADDFASAFQSIQMKISVRNTTSRTEISDGETKSPKVLLLEFLERGLALEMPRNSCAQGHAMSIEITVTEPAPKRMKLLSTAKVQSVGKDSEEADRVELSLVQYDEAMLDRLIHMFANRQLEIDDFFKAAKGY